MKTFENKLNDMLLLSCDWRTDQIFKQEVKSLISILSARVATTEDRVTIARDVGGLKAVISIQDNWLRNQLETITEPGFKAPEVSWVM
jgi:hypothetical protein